MINKEDFAELIQKLRDLKIEWEGKSWIDFPYDYFWTMSAEEDGGDTDLYKCSIGENHKEIAFIVEVAPITRKIVQININYVDFLTESEFEEGVSLEEEEK